MLSSGHPFFVSQFYDEVVFIRLLQRLVLVFI